MAWLLSFTTHAAPDALDLMQRSHQAALVKGSRMTLKFELVDERGGVRVRTVESASRQQPGTRLNSRVSRYTYPLDARLETLLVEHDGQEDEMWVHLPALGKTRRVVADGKRDSFMGTVLSYGDVLGHAPALWRHEVVGESDWEGRRCWVVRSTPASEHVQRQTGYSRRESCVDMDTAFNWRMETWDESGQPLKVITNRKVTPVAEQPGAWVAREVEARNLQTGAVTRVRMERFEYAPRLPADEFAPAALGADE